MDEKQFNVIKDFIHKAPLGQYLGLHGCKLMAKTVSAVRTLEDNEYLYHSGDPSDNFFMLASGRLALCFEDPKTNCSRIIHVMETGDLTGELSFVIEDSYNVSVQSIGASSVYVFDREPINKLYEENPNVMFDFLKAIIKRIHSTTASINQQKDELTAYLASGGRSRL